MRKRLFPDPLYVVDLIIGIIIVVSGFLLYWYFYKTPITTEVSERPNCARLHDTTVNMEEKNLNILRGISGPLGGTALELSETGRRTERYFLMFDFWKLNDDYSELTLNSSKFFANSNGFFLKIYQLKKAAVGCDTILASAKKVPFAIDDETKTLLIPVSKNVYEIQRVIAIGFAVLLILVSLFYYIGGFVKFLINVSQGRAFSKNNLIVLRNFLIVAVAIYSLIIIANLLYRIIFAQYFNEYIILNYSAAISSFKSVPIVLLVYLIYRAFKKGYKLQQENDLTV